MIKLDPKKILGILVTTAFLLVIIYISVSIRMGTIDSRTVLDYDPFWWYRYAEMIVKNNFQAPKWDLLSFYPPGRPVSPFQGWPYTIASFYEILKTFNPAATLTKAAILSPLIMVALTSIPAFFLGRTLTKNNIAGLAVALFITLSPTFIGVSMAGYCDSDAPVVFYSFLSVLFVILALKKRTIPFYALAIFANLLFVFNWGGGWVTLILFLALIPAVIVFRIIEYMIHSRKLSLNLSEILEVKTLLLPLVIIFLATNIITYVLWQSSMISSFLGGLAFTGLFGQPLLVNVSVAELQIINIFTRDGFLSVASRIGILPFVLTMFGLPILVLYKIYKKEKISFEEIFLFLWAMIMLILITRGIRFALMFAIAASTAGGYVIGNLYNYLRKGNIFIFVSVFGVIGLFMLTFISDAINIGYSSSEMELSQNWYDALDWLSNRTNVDKRSLVATWWDPGHILAGYTGLRVMADGAHCSPQDCIPYDHNIRIQNMGRIFSLSNEDDALSLLKNYKSLSPQDCQKVRDTFGSIVPNNSCDPVSDIYVIASSDLIGKYVWMNYFGMPDYRAKSTDPGACEAPNTNTYVWCFWQLGYPTLDQSSGNPTWADGAITLLPPEGTTFMQCIQTSNCTLYPIWGSKYVVTDFVYFDYFGNQRYANFVNQTNIPTLDGMLWIDPGFGMAIYMPPSVRDSIFTRMFFFSGQGLDHFKLVYSNPELRIFKVVF